MLAFLPYSERSQRELLSHLFIHTDLLERLTGIPIGKAPIDREPHNGLFAFTYRGSDGLPVYLYFRASTIGSPKTEYDQIREQASFIHRNPDAHYFALLLREAWFEWGDNYLRRRLELPIHQLGYEELLSHLAEVDLASFPASSQADIQAYHRYLQKEYEGILSPAKLVDMRLRQYAILWHIRREINKRLSSTPVEWDIRTQPHVHSSHLDQVFMRQYPPYRLQNEGFEISLFWELGKDGLFLRMGLPPMREKAARSLHAYIRKQAQFYLAERFILGRTRGTLKGIDTYHAREVNLLRVEVPALQELNQAAHPDALQTASEKVAEELTQAVKLLPELSKRIETAPIPSR